jgi:SAM-dependent methyltransferase
MTWATRLTDQAFLRGEQYRDSGNLRARMALHERFSTNQYGWHRWVFDQLALPAQCRVLELGCGPGRLWLENAERLPAGLRLVLSDYSLGMAREARRNLRDAAPGADIAAANVDIQAIPFAAASFDFVVANHMLYHVPDRPRALAEVRRVLAPGGRFYAATNGDRHMRELDDLSADAGGPRRPGMDLAFRLENGGNELAAIFSDVTLKRYDDALVITEAAPLLAYALSMSSADTLDSARLARTVEQALARHGAIRITKDTGLFVASARED